MNDKVTPLDIITTNNIPVNKVIDAAVKEKFKEVIIIGVLDNGERYYATSNSNIAEVLMEVELFKLVSLEDELD